MVTTKKTTTSKRGLGKGLQALFSESELTNSEGASEIAVDEIRPNSFQPRRQFDEEKINELAQSITTHGVLQPVVVRQLIGGYELVAGERRWRACQLAQLKTIPAIIREFSDRDMMEIALVENLQREDLNPMEEAHALKALAEGFEITQEELSQRIGKSRSQIANTLRLLNLPPDIQDHVSRGTLSMGHARALLGIADQRKQGEVCQVVVERGLSVRQTEELVRKAVADTKKDGKGPTKEKEPYLMDIENTLQETLGTKVLIKAGKERGKIEIEYYTNDDLERICRLLGTEL